MSVSGHFVNEGILTIQLRYGQLLNNYFITTFQIVRPTIVITINIISVPITTIPSNLNIYKPTLSHITNDVLYMH